MRTSQQFERMRGGTTRIDVLGYGVSNRPAVAWLVDHGIPPHRITVRDRRSRAQLETAGDLARLDTLGVRLVCGDGYLAGLPGADVILRTPGIRPDLPEITVAVAAGAWLTSEMELFLELTEAFVLGVTGSDGKTTTTTLTSLILEEYLRGRGRGRMYLGGNIGSPLLPQVEHMTPDDVAVLELSSFQLMTLDCSPDRAAVTNLSPNHLNWHTDMQEYVAAKANICTHIPPNAPLSAVVLNAEDICTRELGLTLPPDLPILWFSRAADRTSEVIPSERADCPDRALYLRDGRIHLTSGSGDCDLLDVSRIRLPGRHNLENFMTALGLCEGLMPAEELARCARVVADRFTGVPHRLELVAEAGGVRYYNSSIDSSPTRTAAALAALADLREREGGGWHKPIVICGGRDKHLSFAPLAEALCRGAAAVILAGEAREQIYDALIACPHYDPKALPITIILNWQEAMETACRSTRPGDVLLLSPACTSFDAFPNFEVRGECFRETVRRFLSESASKERI